jgi:cytochrome c oxidase cbb3-type subunit 3
MARTGFSLRMLALLMCTLSALVPAQQRSAHEGRQIFATRCATCHGLDGQGGERGPNIANRREVQQLSDAALLEIVRNGIPGAGMPSFRTLGSTKIEAVVQHLRFLQGRGEALPLSGDPARGKAVFSGKAQCTQCHTVNGEGGFLGSDLSSYASTQSAEEIRSAITDPNKNLDPRRQTVVVTVADGTAITGIARNEDNFSLQLQTMDGAFHSFTKSDLQRIEHQPRSLMPADYGTRLSRGEIDDVISYLMKVGRAHPEPKPVKNDN